ncbi:MAG: toll/interleukin-1 receptor domain-containing protein [Myxococcota bacterium]
MDAVELKLFISYRSKDADHAAALRRHLIPYTRASEGVDPKGWYVDPWLDSEQLLGGDALEASIVAAIEEADLMVCLLSAWYFESDWCRKERELAAARGVRVIPVVVSRCAYGAWGFDDAILLPPKARPVDEWTSSDAAWSATVEAIRKVCAQRLVGRDRARPAVIPPPPRRRTALGLGVIGLVVVAGGAAAALTLGGAPDVVIDTGPLAEVREVVAELAIRTADPDALEESAQRLETLYVAHPTLFSDPRVLPAIEALRREVRFYREGEVPLDGTSPEDRLKQAAIRLARACDEVSADPTLETP